MTREDIEKSFEEAFQVPKEVMKREIDFVVSVVQAHNEECARIADRRAELVEVDKYGHPHPRSDIAKEIREARP